MPRPGRLRLTRPLLALALLPLLLTTACDELGSDDPVETRDDTFQVSGAVTIDVDSFNGDINIVSTDSNEVRVQATLKRADKLEYSADLFGSDVQVKAERRGSTVGRSPSATIDISAPASSELVLRTSNGEIEVRGFDAEATVRTSNGRIVVNGLSGDLEADTSNGAIEVSGFTGQARLETSNGSISLSGELVEGSDNDIESSNGGITVDLEGEPGLTLDAATSNGSVSTDFPIRITSSGRNHLEGVIGDGGTSLHIRTSNGSITVK